MFNVDGEVHIFLLETLRDQDQWEDNIKMNLGFH